jgi:glycolate oxidase FAD binding subunit
MSMEEKQSFPISQDSDLEIPKTEKEVSSIIKKFYKSNIPIEIIGSGSKRKIGKPLQCGKTLDLSQLDGIIEYLPEELYIKVKAGTRIDKIENELKKKNQHLAFEPIDFGYLFLDKSNCGTAGGQVACNIAGPRRLKSGSIRDHILGFRAVNGRGDIIKSGGNVVKNVTGYDLSKLICNSYGTLAAITEITFKVLPAPEENKTLVVHDLNIESSMEYLSQAINSSNDISGAAFLPMTPNCENCKMDIKNTFQLNDLKQNGSLTAIRVEGSKKSVDERIKNLQKRVTIPESNLSLLESLQSSIFWSKIRNLEFFSGTKNNIFRIVLPPTETSKLLYKLPQKYKYFLDWGGSVIWMEACELSEQYFNSIRKKVLMHGGYLSMIKNSDFLPYVEDVFTINHVRFNISQSIKKSFDPKRILNPGKMYSGI